MTVVLVPNRSVPPAAGHGGAGRPRPRPPRRTSIPDRIGARPPATGSATVTEPGRARPPRNAVACPVRPSSPLRRTIRYWVARLVASIDRPRLPPGPPRGPRAAAARPGDLLLQPPELGRPVRPDGRPAVPAAALVLRAEGGGHGASAAGTGSCPGPGRRSRTSPARTTCSRRPGGSAAVIAPAAVVAIAGEGRIHVRESELLPLSEGAAYFALRSGVPLVPIAINGTSWLRFGGRVRVRVGEPIPTAGRPTREAVARRDGAADGRAPGAASPTPRTSPSPGRVGRWVTERFNDWPEGSREAAASGLAEVGRSAHTPRPLDPAD